MGVIFYHNMPAMSTNTVELRSRRWETISRSIGRSISRNHLTTWVFVLFSGDCGVVWNLVVVRSPSDFVPWIAAVCQEHFEIQGDLDNPKKRRPEGGGGSRMVKATGLDREFVRFEKREETQRRRRRAREQALLWRPKFSWTAFSVLNFGVLERVVDAPFGAL